MPLEPLYFTTVGYLGRFFAELVELIEFSQAVLFGLVVVFIFSYCVLFLPDR